MLPRIEMLKIALAHAQNGAAITQRKRPPYRSGYMTDLVGLFIPASTYYATYGIELMTTFQLRYAGIFDDQELKFINEMDEIQTLDRYQWAGQLQRQIDDELKTGD